MPTRHSICFFLSLLAWSVSYGQVCTGSLGDPVINVDFGSGTGTGAPIIGNTNYQYSREHCPFDGNYALLNRSANCYNSTWHNLPEDHTPGDINGYMMVVNASFNPGDFYVDTVRGLCANTTYEFAAWMLNVMKPTACAGNGGIKPNLSFTIETISGTRLGVYNTGNIPESTSPMWKQYSLMFTMPPGTNDIILRLTNNAPGGCGNDVILDDITFRPCGATVKAKIDFDGGRTSTSVCENTSIRFNFKADLSEGFKSPSLQWQVSTDGLRWQDVPGAVTTAYQHNVSTAGNYLYRLAVAETGNILYTSCRIVSNILSVQVNPKPKILLTAANPACEGSSLALSATGGQTYQWAGPAGFNSTQASPKAIASLNNSGKYVVNVATQHGCTGTDSITLRVFPKTIVRAGNDQTVCEGGSVALDATPGLSYLWSPATGLSSATIQNPVAKPTDTTLYIVAGTDENGCVSYDTQTVHILKKPVANAGPDLRLYNGQSVTLKSSVKGTNVSFKWNPSNYMNNSDSPTPTIRPKSDITYTLFVESNVGCGKTRDEVSVSVLHKIFVPSAFSPNGDGINDSWEIKELQYFNQPVISVFNRYGQKVFQSTGYATSWKGVYNGRPLPAGNYYYVIDLKTGGAVTTGGVMIAR